MSIVRNSWSDRWRRRQVRAALSKAIVSVDFRLVSYREWHGLPWGFSGQPVPVPIRTHTRTQGSGFATYGSWVGYNPRVSKPVWDRNAGLHVYYHKAI